KNFTRGQPLRFHDIGNFRLGEKEIALYRMKFASVITSLVILAAVFLFATCGRQEQKPVTTTEKKLNVVTTVAPITSIVENIGSDKIQLAGIIPEGINSHTFEPIPSDSKLLSSADLIILNGLDLETPTLRLIKSALERSLLS